MAKLFTVKHASLREELDAAFDREQSISSQDLFDTFVRTLGKETNVLKEEELKALVFNQFKSYGDFDKTMNEVAKNVSDIQQSTEDAIKAIDNNDSGSLKSAYSQLKDYQKRIMELEDDLYTDDLTGVYNRKYLMNHELSPNELFKMNGTLMHLSINNFLEINREHGNEAGDAVLKFVSKLLQKNLSAMGIHLIRYMGTQFVALSKEVVAPKTEKVFQETVDLVMSKKFKTHEGELLNISLQFNSKDFKIGDDFQGVYKGL